MIYNIDFHTGKMNYCLKSWESSVLFESISNIVIEQFRGVRNS